MKKLTALLLCIALIISCVPAAMAKADTSAEPTDKLKMLTDLGLLGKYEPNADVTRSAFRDTVDTMNGDDSYLRYIENRDMKEPVLYGQVLMVLVDMTGWTPLVQLNGWDEEDPLSYYKLAVRSGMTKKQTGDFDKPIKIEDYADLLYGAICDAKMLKMKYYLNGEPRYEIDSEARLLDYALNLYEVEGVLTGVGDMTLDGRVSGQDSDKVAVDGKWYRTEPTVDADSCFGMAVTAYADKENNRVRAILPSGGKNDVVKLRTDDLYKSDTTVGRVTYDDGSGKKKTITLDKEADFVFNRRLVQSYTADDLQLDGCSYSFVDNDNDSKYDVIIAYKYDTFMIGTVMKNETMLVDKNNNTYNLEDYLHDGGAIRDAAGKKINFEDLTADTVVSCAAARSGKYTDFRLSTKKLSGIIGAMQDDWQKIFVSGTEYETLNSYYAHRGDFDSIDVGDEAELYFDFEGYVANIKRISRLQKAGFAFGTKNLTFGTVQIQLLNESGKLEIADIASSVYFNGKKIKSSELEQRSELYNADGFIPQMILYKQSEDGTIYKMETAEDNHGTGVVLDDRFTLDFDSKVTGTEVRAISLNGKNVLASKYIMDADSKLFVADFNDKESSYVLPATSVPTNTNLTVRLYNVDENYVPAYILMTYNGTDIGAWVDKWETTYVADRIVRAYDPETEEARSKLIYYDGSGKEYSVYICDTGVKPVWGNAMYPSKDDNPRSAEISNARNSRYVPIEIKDIRRGTVFQFNRSSKGLTSYAIQQMPEANDNEIVFEGSNLVSGYNYGTSKYLFNASSLASYGMVIKKTPSGLIINNYATTPAMTAAAEKQSDTFPNHDWDRAFPINAGTFVWIYDKSDDKLYRATAAEIAEGDMIFIHRKATTVNTVIVYRD